MKNEIQKRVKTAWEKPSPGDLLKIRTEGEPVNTSYDGLIINMIRSKTHVRNDCFEILWFNSETITTENGWDIHDKYLLFETSIDNK